MSLRQAMQAAQERARARREAAAQRYSQGSIPLARRLDFDNLSDEEPELDEQQQRYDALAREEERRIERGDAFGIRTQQERELREDPLQRSQPGHIPSGGKRRKSRKSHKSRKVGGGRKSRKVGGGRKSRKSRKIGGGRKSRKVRRSRR